MLLTLTFPPPARQSAKVDDPLYPGGHQTGGRTHRYAGARLG